MWGDRSTPGAAAGAALRPADLSPFRAPAPGAPRPADLAPVWGDAAPGSRAPRVLGLFAHPDDEVFCIGGTVARCAGADATTAIVSLTRGEAGQIRDAAAATRRTLGAVRARELARSGDALGVDEVSCLDLGDGRLDRIAPDRLAATVRGVIEDFRPDVVVTFGPDGATGHADHVASCHAGVAAVAAMADPPRLLHARFPMQEQLMLDVIVAWLTSKHQRFSGTAAFGHALKLFADGSSMLGFAADHFEVEWFPAGSFIIEQGEAATELFCILSGSVDVMVEHGDGPLRKVATTGAGCFVGEEGLATGRPRNAHVIAREDVTCLVLAPQRRSRTAARGARAGSGTGSRPGRREPGAPGAGVTVDVRAVLDRKVAALAAHRTQYALDADLLPRPLLESLLGTEHFTVVHPTPANGKRRNHELAAF